MENFPDLLRPLIFISGIGLLLLSTSARFGQLECQLKEAAARKDEKSGTIFAGLATRAIRFRQAIRSLYASLGLLSGGVLVGAVLYPFTPLAAPLVLVLTTVSHVFVVIAVIALFRESGLSIEVFKHRARLEAGEANR